MEPDEADTVVAIDEPRAVGTDSPATFDRADLGAFSDYEPAEPDPTPLTVDPNVVVGMLDNGLTYYLRSNDSPAEQVSMRLVVDAGALLDPPGAEGVAHLLEHMLFNGTERFSKNDLGQVLLRHHDHLFKTTTDADLAAAMEVRLDLSMNGRRAEGSLSATGRSPGRRGASGLL